MISIQSPRTESASAVVAVRARKVMPVTAYLPRDVRLATLAHELRSPLAAIQFATVALQGRTVDGGSLRALALIERQVLRMSHLLAGLAERPGARLPANTLAQPACLCSVVRNALETLAPDYRLHRHHLSVAFPAHAPKVRGDALRLEQVFVNLLGNASRYTDDGGEISVRVWVEGDVACVRILDSGIGIAAEELPHGSPLAGRLRHRAGRRQDAGRRTWWQRHGQQRRSWPRLRVHRSPAAFPRRVTSMSNGAWIALLTLAAVASYGFGLLLSFIRRPR
jgi:hypothetical protein